MADDSKKVTAQLKDIIRELQMLQGGNKSLLQEYQKTGEELAQATKEGDRETVEYLKEFRQQARKELEKTVAEKFEGQKIDPLVLRSAFAALPYAGKIEKETPAGDHNEHLRNVAAGAKPDSVAELTPRSFTKSFTDVLSKFFGTPGTLADYYRRNNEFAEGTMKALSKSPREDIVRDKGTPARITEPAPDRSNSDARTFKNSFEELFTNFFGGPAAIRNRYRRGDAIAKSTLNALVSMPVKIANVLERLPLISGIANFIKSFVSTIGSALAVVGAVVSLSGFLKGWENAKKWFGENADFWDKLSSGLAAIAQTFLGLSEEDAQDLAKKISKGIHTVTRFLSDLFTQTLNVVKVAWANADKFIKGFQTAWNGIVNGSFKDILSGTKSIFDVLGNVAKAIWDNKLALIPIFLLFKGPIIAAIGAIAGVVGGIASVLSGPIIAAFTGLLSFIGGTLLPILAPIIATAGAIGASLVVFKGAWDGLQAAIDEYKKTGSVISALKTGINQFGNSVVSTLTQIWNTVLDSLASVVELIPWKGKDIAASIRKNKLSDVVAAPSPSSNVVGVQEAEKERQRLSAANASAARVAAAAPVVVQQQSSTTNNNTTAVQVPLATHSGASFAYI